MAEVNLLTGSLRRLGNSGITNLQYLAFAGGKLYTIDKSRTPNEIAEVDLANGSLRRLGSTGSSLVTYLAGEPPPMAVGDPPRLSALSGEDFPLTPLFEPDIGSYTMVLPSAYAGSVRLAASVFGSDTITMVDADSTVVGPTGGRIGSWTVTAGSTETLRVTVASADATATYSVTIVRA